MPEAQPASVDLEGARHPVTKEDFHHLQEEVERLRRQVDDLGEQVARLQRLADPVGSDVRTLPQRHHE